MSRKEHIYTFFTNDSHKIPVHVFIDNLPQNCTARVHSTTVFNGSWWFIFYSVRSGDRIEFFYELVKDSNESGDYELTIDYDLTHPICSFDSTEEITFVDSRNDVLVEQPPIFSVYEYAHDSRLEREYKMFLVIYNNTIVICWNDEDTKVSVKTFDLSSFFSSREYGTFSRVDYDFVLTPESCKITFYTVQSEGNQYFSAYIDFNPFSADNLVSVILHDHRLNQLGESGLRSSPYIPDTDDKIESIFLNLTHYVDGKLLEDDSDTGSDARSEEEDY